MGRTGRRAVATALALLAGAAVFAASARTWGRTETRRVRVKFDDRHGPRLLRLDAPADAPAGKPSREDRLEYVAAPADAFRQARPGDEVLCTVRRIPEFEVASADFRLRRDGREIARWSEGGPFFWIACAGLSLLAGIFATWIGGLLLRPFVRWDLKPALAPPTRLRPLPEEITPFAH